ncbi:hypothetical protein [Pectobacterium aquaticum]|uniref:hypothetical protein n=1 Tax=Pectobacterium aquaticum TaxID=2204145 RepID=UPI000F635D97|nr:hypothetical protein [Pectobacterium aquaticum]UEM37669.1 hypothetical protein DMB82_0010625 [Pectobacterium aquaticum]UEM37682.1 hypothetical protein DMB82_0010690 [Pectobacterium aquaticum]
MTSKEYAQKIATQLWDAPHNYKEILINAERVINNAFLTKEAKQRFWVELYHYLGGNKNISTASQDSAKLHELIAKAKSIVVQKTQQGN